MFDPEEDLQLSALLREGDPAGSLPPSRAQALKLELLARCEATLTESPAPVPVRRRWRNILLAAGALTVSAAAALMLVGLLSNPLIPQPEGQVAVVITKPAINAHGSGTATLGGAATQGSMVSEAPPVRKERRHGVPEFISELTKPRAVASAPVAPKVARRNRPAASAPAESQLTASSQAVERLVIDVGVAPGPREEPPPFTSVTLLMSGSPDAGSSSVGIIYTHDEEKTP